MVFSYLSSLEVQIFFFVARFNVLYAPDNLQSKLWIVSFNLIMQAV